MSVWSARVEGSGVGPLVEQVRSLALAVEGGDQAEREHLHRAEAVADLVKWTWENVDPELVGQESIDLVVSGLQAAAQHLQGWRDGLGVEYLTVQTRDGLDQVVRGLAGIPLPAADPATEIGSLRRSVGQHRGQMEREVEAFRQQSAEALAALVAQHGAAAETMSRQLDGMVAEVASLRDEVTRIRDEVNALLTNARAMDANQQQTFGAAQTANQEAFATLLAESRTALEASTEKLQAQMKAVVDKIEVDMRVHVDDAGLNRGKVEEIYNIVGKTALLGSYATNAERERTEAAKWRRVAIAAAVVAIVIGLWAAIVAADAGSDWDMLVAKVVLGSGVAAVAAYAARQSAEHRNTQRDAEHVAVQLAAIKPYLNDLEDPTERDKLLIEVAQRLFGQARIPSNSSEDLSKLLSDDPSLLTAIVTAVQAASKK